MNNIEIAIKGIQSLLRSGFHLSVGFSGGKDSTACVILLIESIKRLMANGEDVPNCYITNSNTRREMPSMDVYLEGTLAEIGMYLARNKLPVEVKQVEPNLSGRFTWTTIGRGKLPRYVGASRDCARDEKIYPQQRLAKQIEKETGGKIISIIGSRITESSTREANMKRYSMTETTIVEIDGTRTFAPIANWELDEVWDLIAGTAQVNGAAPRYFPTFQKDFSELTKLYRDANDGVCGVIIGDKGNSGGCGSRFGCAYCLTVGDRDKSLESLISEDPSLYGYMEGLVKFREYLLAIRWDLSSRDYRGRFVSKTNFMKVTPDYFSPRVKRQLLRFLLTLDKKEEERAAEWDRLWHEGKIEHTEENALLKYPMFQFIKYSDILAIDFAWSISRDWDECSPAAQDWIAVHDLGVKYEIPTIKPFERVQIPPVRWFDVSVPVNNVVGLKGLIPSGHKLKELQVDYAKTMHIEDGAGFCYLNMVRENYYDLGGIDPAECCRIILHHGWLKMQPHEVERYDQIARRNDYLYRLMREQKPMKENPFNGEDQLMTIHEFLIENSISNQEHNKLLDKCEIESIENDEQMDLLGASSIIEMRNVTPIKKHRDVSQIIKTESVVEYFDAGKQAALF